MKAILFDECVPWPLRQALAGHECSTAQRMGWKSVKNGELLRHAESHFDLFLTSDQGIAYQQNLGGRRIAIVELSTNNLRRLLRAAEMIRSAIADAEPGEYRRLNVP